MRMNDCFRLSLTGICKMQTSLQCLKKFFPCYVLLSYCSYWPWTKIVKCIFVHVHTAGVSEDSDYTSDINYPIGQHANSSASQFLSVANQLSTPQRSLNSSRENSYEKDDSEHYGQSHYHHHRTSNGGGHSVSPYSYHHHQHLHHHHQPSSSSYSQSSSSHRKQLPTIPTQQQQQSSRRPNANHRGGGGGGYWDDPRDSETDPLYYNSRPQSDYKSYRYRI